MTKRTVQGLAWMLLATPLVLVGCSDNGDKDGGTGGAGGLRYDGGGGTGGSHLDGGLVVDAQPAPVDTQLVIDTAVADAPVQPDVPVVVDVAPALDVSLIDTRPFAVDTAAIDTTPAIDASPVAVCTESKKFSGGDVTKERTLTKACSPYTIASTIYVNKGATLTVEPGTTLKFDTSQRLRVYAGAIINAIGTAADPIVFTSSKSVPAAGDWQGVSLETGSNSVTLKYVTVAFAGYGDNAAVDVSEATSDVENCTIHDNAGIGIDATGAVKGTKVLGNTFYSNGSIPLIIAEGAQADATNTFHSGTLVNDKQFVAFAGDIATTRTFDITEVPYLFESSFYVQKNANLTVAAGATLAFDSGSRLRISTGAIFNAIGTATAPVVFTSSKTVPAQGDWQGLSFETGASSIAIKYATIQYAGFGENYAVDATSSTFDIENCTIQHNLSGGLDGSSSVRATLKNNTFSDNNADGTTIFNYSMDGATNATVSGNTP